MALAKISDRLYAIEVHRAILDKTCFLRVGAVNKKDRTITWGDPHPKLRLECSVVKPKISVARNGVFFLIHEKAYSRYDLQYHFGRLEKDQLEDQETLRFRNLNHCLPSGLRGVEPDVSIIENKIIVVYRSGFWNRLDYRIGVIAQNEIQWHAVTTLPASGVNPSISINGRGYVVEAHQTKLKQICHLHGHIVHNSIVWHGMASEGAGFGEYPSISLADDECVIEMHKGLLPHRLLQSVGLLRNQLQDYLAEQESPQGED